MRSLNRNVYGYVIGIILTFLVTFLIFVNGVYFINNYFSNLKSYSILIIALLIVLGFICVFGLSLLFKIKEAKNSKAADYFIFGIILLLGILIRVLTYSFGINNIEYNSLFFDSRVGYKTFFGIASFKELYSDMIYGLMYVFGNKLEVSLLGNLFLDSFSFILAYAAVRSFSGRVVSIFLAISQYLSIWSVNLLYSVSEIHLFMFAFSLCLYGVSLIITKKSNYIFSLLFGVIVGVFCFYDVMFLGFLPVAILGYANKESAKNKWNNFLINILIYGIALIFSLAGAIVAFDGFNFSFTPFMNWAINTFIFDFSEIGLLSGDYFNLLVLLSVLIFLLMSLYSFLISKREDIISPIYCILVVGILIIIFSNSDIEKYIYISLNLVFGILGSFFYYICGGKLKFKRKETISNIDASAELDQSKDYVPLEIPIVMPVKKKKAEIQYDIEEKDGDDYAVDINDEDDYRI